jgi:hypothetical protein
MKSGSRIVLVLLALGVLSAVVMTFYMRSVSAERAKAHSAGTPA